MRPPTRTRTRRHSPIPAGRLVRYYLQPDGKTALHEEWSPGAVVEALEAGLPVAELTELQENLDLPMEQLAPMLGISKATFHRRKESGAKLQPAVADRVVRFARLLGKAI